MNPLTKLTTQALLEAGCYHVPPSDGDEDAQLIAFNVSGWNVYAASGEPVLLLDTPGVSLGYCFGDDVEADIERMKRIIRKVKRDYNRAIAHQYQQLTLF